MRLSLVRFVTYFAIMTIIISVGNCIIYFGQSLIMFLLNVITLLTAIIVAYKFTATDKENKNEE